jgi:benzoylformate decarboxylase
MTGARAILECLKMEGVKYIFGAPGTGEAALLEEVCHFPDITYMLTLHENVTVGMADGLARGGGGIGVVNVHTSAGTSNSIGPLYNAFVGKLPVLMIVGNKDVRILGRNCFSEVRDFPAMTSQFTKWSWETRRADRIPEDLLRGIKIATTLPRGPVFLSVTEDQFKEEIEVKELVSLRPKSPLLPAGNEEEIGRAARLLVNAKKPLFIAGNEIAGCKALDEAVWLAEALGLPVMTEARESVSTLNFPHSHPSFRGVFDPASPYVKEADVILGMGCKMFVQMRYPIQPEIPAGATILHFQSDPYELGRTYPEEVAVLCDAGQGLARLKEAVIPLLTDHLKKACETRRLSLKREKERLVAEREEEIRKAWERRPISIARLAGEMNRTLPKDTIIVEEAIRSAPSFLRFYDFEVPGTYHANEGGFIGWCVPAALGMKLANPERRVVAFVGDGGFLFSPQSLWTAARYNIPVIIVIPNNRQYQAVRDACIRYDGPAARSGRFVGCDIREPEIDICQLAASFGVWARKVSEPEEIGPRLEEALELGKPTLIDVRIA